MNILAFDIGGTKCAVITARWDDESITLLKKKNVPLTFPSPRRK